MHDENNFDWALVALRLLAPAYVSIIEALSWIERPLTAVEIARVVDRPAAVTAVQFRLRQLAAAGGVEVAKGQRVRGAMVRWYRLVERNSDSS